LTSYRYQSRLRHANGQDQSAGNLPKHFSKTMESNFYVPLSSHTAEDITPIQKLTLSSRESSDNNRGFISQNIKSEQFSSIKDFSNSSMTKKEDA
jgi:hypothetical protein